jgi:hypothetical protein
VLGKNREVDSVAEPGRPERIWITEPNFYGRHKMSVFYPLRARAWQRLENFLYGTQAFCLCGQRSFTPLSVSTKQRTTCPLAAQTEKSVFRLRERHT